MKLRLLALACLAFGTGAQAEGVRFDLADLITDAPVTGTVDITDVAKLPDTDGCAIALRIALPRFLSELDAYGRAERNMGSDKNKVYWVGPTRYDRAEGDTLHVVTRARYERWQRILGSRNKVLQDTKTVRLSVSMPWNAEQQVLQMITRITNIENFPDEWEDKARRPKTRNLDLRGSETLRKLMPTFDGAPRFELLGETGITLSANLTATLPVVRVPGLNIVAMDTCVAIGSAIRTEPQEAQRLLSDLLNRL